MNIFLNQLYLVKGDKQNNIQMKKYLLVVFVALATALSVSQAGAAKKASNEFKQYFGAGLCKQPGYHCIKIKKGDSWEKLFPNEKQLDIVQRVNRTNMRLWAGKTIAVPDNLKDITALDVAPFPKNIKPSDNQLIVVDQNKLAWGAYNREGDLVHWGPISSGKDFCKDIKRSCNTRTGEFYVFNKKGAKCSSNIYPVGRGGSEMPYCMFFYRGFALHGSNEVPGYRASHGCVRIFTEDAKWLNLKFVEIPNREGTIIGTKVVVQKLKKGSK